MWLQRLLARIRSHPGPILIEGGEVYGAPFLIDALRQSEQVAWMQLTPADAADFTATGNRLADAVNIALDAKYLPQALPFNYSLSLLMKRLPLVKPLTIVCSNADYTPLFRDSLLEMPNTKAKVILVTNGTTAFRGGLHLRQAELALTPDEAETLAGYHLSSNEIQTLWRSCGGEYLTFLSSLHRLRDLELPPVPSPQGAWLQEEADLLVSPPAMLEVLVNLKRYVEALEVAVMSVPERVADIITEAGNAYQNRGLLKRLHLLLESLDEKHLQDEKVLGWRLVAGFDQANYAHLMPVIESYLEKNEAPELRARYAGMLMDMDERFRQAQRAEKAKSSSLSLWQLGRNHPDGKKGIEILHRAVKLAEIGGEPYEIARNTGTLAEALIYVGRFREAAVWSQWALNTNRRMGSEDGMTRLLNVCTDADVRTILGQTQGLRETLTEIKDAATSADLNILVQIQLTLANLEIVSGNILEAQRLAADNLARGLRHRQGDLSVPLVRTLLEQDKLTEALIVAKEVSILVADEDPFHALPASLALGMVYSFVEPDSAPEHLIKILEVDDIDAVFRITAALHLLRIGAIEIGELDPKLVEIMRDLPSSGFRLFSGPETAFADTWDLFAGKKAPLRIKVLGHSEVWLNNKYLQLGDRAVEALVILALYPEGLTPEALHDLLYRSEDVKLNALRAAISRLRSHVPISTNSDTYRITVPFAFDVDDCKKAIAAGDIETATQLYQGALLDRSDAPGIVEARRNLEEQFRHLTLRLGDGEKLLSLAKALDDIELWQAANAALPRNDARLPSVRAQLQKAEQSIEPTYN